MSAHDLLSDEDLGKAKSFVGNREQGHSIDEFQSCSTVRVFRVAEFFYHFSGGEAVKTRRLRCPPLLNVRRAGTY